MQDKYDKIFTHFNGHEADLLPILLRIQERDGYISQEAVRRVSRFLRLSENQIYGVASFYPKYRFTEPGKKSVKVCMGTACHVRGGEIILENFERKLEIKEGETTEDREFSIERVACVGCCALAPVALVGETLHGHMAPSKVEGLVLRVRLEKEKAEREAARL